MNYLHINIPFFLGSLDTAFLRDEEPNVKNERIPMGCYGQRRNVLV